MLTSSRGETENCANSNVSFSMIKKRGHEGKGYRGIKTLDGKRSANPKRMSHSRENCLDSPTWGIPVEEKGRRRVNW